MKIRIISGIIGFILLLSVVMIGGLVLDISVLIISIIGLFEFNHVIKFMNLKPMKILNNLFAISLFFINILSIHEYIQPLIFIFTIILMILLVIDKDIKPLDVGINLLAVIYVVFFIFHISLFSKMQLSIQNGKYLIWLIFITAWATDTFAYFSGNFFGKRKLCPELSPKKTIEGAIGGIIGSLLVTIIFLNILNIGYVFRLSILSIICSIFAQFGDLAASKIKRVVGIKDYGNLIPGHGGVLDRFDSILFTAPIVYYYIAYLL